MQQHSGRITASAGWLIPGDGGIPLEKVALHIEAGIIRRIDPLPRRDMATDVDLAGHTLLPGFVDSHVHLTMSGSGDPVLRERQLRYRFDEACVVIRRHLEAHTRHGVLAVRDGGDHHGHTLRCIRTAGGGCDALAHLVQVRTAGRAVKRKGRYGGLIGRDVDTHASLEAAVADELARVHQLKVVNSGLNSLTCFGRQTAPQFSPDEMEKMVRMARASGRRVMVHANGERPVRTAIEAGCTSIEHGFFMGRENLARMADRQTCWVPTACTMAAYGECLDRNGPEADMARRNLDHQLNQMRMARDLGVPVAVGTDSGSLGVHHGTSLASEISLLVQSGYALHEAISCATVNGAELLGIGEGWALKAGHPAVFLAAPASPATLLENIRALHLFDFRNSVL